VLAGNICSAPERSFSTSARTGRVMEELGMTALQWTLWLVVMATVMGWLARSRLRARPASDARRLVHPPSTLIVGLVAFAFFAGLPSSRTSFPTRPPPGGRPPCSSVRASGAAIGVGIFPGRARSLRPGTCRQKLCRREKTGALVRPERRALCRVDEMVPPGDAIRGRRANLGHVDGVAGIRALAHATCAGGRDRRGDIECASGHGRRQSAIGLDLERSRATALASREGSALAAGAVHSRYER
jgi:hypothetical protein